MDEAAVEAKGLTPFEPWLEQVPWPQVARRASQPSTRKRAGFGIGTPFGGFVGQDDKAPDQYILQFFQAGLGMPDRDYYCPRTQSSPRRRRNISQHLTNMLTLAGETNAAARAKAIVALETSLQPASWTKRREPGCNQDLQQVYAGRFSQKRSELRFPRVDPRSGAEGLTRCSSLSRGNHEDCGSGGQSAAWRAEGPAAGPFARRLRFRICRRRSTRRISLSTGRPCPGLRSRRPVEARRELHRRHARR